MLVSRRLVAMKCNKRQTNFLFKKKQKTLLFMILSAIAH